MTKIDIISGFLGAGKTTLIKKLLQDSFQNEQVVLIENEFGEIGIDGGFLKESGIEIKEMSSGCICCSLVGDFYTSLKEVIDTYHPDRIVIEPSGVGKLSDVISAVSKVTGENVLLNSYTTVADVTKCKIYLKNFGEFYKNQLEYAGAIILSRTDKVSPEKAEKCLELIRTVNEKAPVVTTPINQLSGEQLLSVIEGVPTLEEEMLKEEEICPVCGHHHDHEHEHHHSDDCCHDHEHHHEHEHDHHEHDCCHDHDHEHDHDCCHDHEHHHEHEHDHHEHDCCHDHHHHADEVFQSFGKETVRPFSEEEISQILSALSDEETYGTILRAKGYLASKDGGEFIHFDMVPEETEIRRGPADYTGRFCVIGAGLKEDAIHALFFQNK
ncbi:MAG: GTP-binding protein [Lachnospiraceae bacterium]|nr:GTP-binding protein [Lachnospiraceae bacterium]